MLEIRNQSDLTEKHIKRKAAGYQRLSSNWLWLFMAVYKPSFADAELREYILEDVVGGDFAGDLTEVVDGGADILAQKFRRESMLQSVQSRIQCRERLAQGVVVALVGDDGLAAVCCRRVHAARERRDKSPYPLARLGREPYGVSILGPVGCCGGAIVRVGMQVDLVDYTVEDLFGCELYARCRRELRLQGCLRVGGVMYVMT